LDHTLAVSVSYNTTTGKWEGHAFMTQVGSTIYWNKSLTANEHSLYNDAVEGGISFLYSETSKHLLLAFGAGL
jgi:hypothetical protein